MNMKKKKAASVIALILAILMIATLVLGAIPSVAYAEELDELKAQRSALAGEVQACQDRINGLKQQQANALEQQAALNEQNRLALEELKLIEQQIEGYNKLIEEKAQEVEKAKNKEADQLERYRTRVRAMEESGGFNILSLIMQSDNFGELITAIDDMGEIMNSDRDLQEQYVQAREETEQIKAEYEEEKAEYEADQDELRLEQEAINQKIEETNKYLEELEQDIQKALEEYKAAEAAEAAAAATIANMIQQLAAQKAAEAEAAKAQAQQMQQANDNAIANGEEPPYSSEEIQQTGNAGSAATGNAGYIWPVPCSTRVTSRFGNRTDPFTGQTRYHSGMDIDGFGNDGNAIVAAASGTVITASADGGYGNYIIIDHGDSQTLYAHMSGFAVTQGSYVEQGQTIGYLGASGRATGTHCHFEVFVGGSRVDPEQYFSGMTFYNC